MVVNLSQKVDGDRKQRNTHQRYESVDNKQKYQAIVNEKMRRKDDQLLMNDPNIEVMLKKMQIQNNNFMGSESSNSPTH